MKVLVTGATGFIGRSLVPHLRRAGHEVVPVGRTAGPDTLAWDLVAPPFVVPAGIEAIVHLAQSRAYRKFPEDARSMFAINVAATQALLDAAVACGVNHFCLASSGTVYEPFTGPIEEHAPLAPTGFLGATKLAAEILAQPYAKHLTLSVLRLFAPYGPGQTDRLIPNLIGRIRDGVPIDVSADGEGLLLALTHVEDVCGVITASLEGWRGTLNVASPDVLSVAGIARQLAGAMGKEVRFNPNLPSAPQIVPDLSRLARLYDLQAMRRFEDSVASLVDRA